MGMIVIMDLHAVFGSDLRFLVPFLRQSHDLAPKSIKTEIQPAEADCIYYSIATVFRQLFFFGKSFLLLNLSRNGLLVAGKDIVHLFLGKLLREQADDRNKNQAADHGNHAGIDGGLENVTEHSAAEAHNLKGYQELNYGHAGGEEKAEPYGCLRNLFGVQAV